MPPRAPVGPRGGPGDRERSDRRGWPLASSASVIVEIATSSGSAATTVGSSQSTTIDVSTSPLLTGQSLVDQLLEIPPEGRPVDPRPGRRGRRNLGPGDEGAPAALERAKLRDRRAVACHDEALPRLDRRQYSRVLISQIALGDDLAHRSSVAKNATS